MNEDQPLDDRWWENRDNLTLLCIRMAEAGYSADQVAYAVEKPWKFTDEFHQFEAEFQASVSSHEAKMFKGGED